MALTKDQISNLLGMVTSSESDEMACDDCFVKVGEFAELHLASKPVPDAMKAVQIHLEQCLCCKDEFDALLKALSAIEE